MVIRDFSVFEYLEPKIPQGKHLKPLLYMQIKEAISSIFLVTSLGKALLFSLTYQKRKQRESLSNNNLLQGRGLIWTRFSGLFFTTALNSHPE
jgi:hypothetical protein